MNQYFTTEGFLMDLECYEMHHLIDAAYADVALEADESASEKKKPNIDVKALGEKIARHVKEALAKFIEWCQKILIKIATVVNRIKARRVKEITVHKDLVNAFNHMTVFIDEYTKITGEFDDVFGMIANDHVAEMFNNPEGTTYVKLMQAKDQCTNIVKKFSDADVLKNKDAVEYLNKNNHSDSDYVKFNIGDAVDTLHELEKAFSNKKRKMAAMNAVYKANYYMSGNFALSQARASMKTINGAIALQNYMISALSTMTMRAQVYINTFLKMGEPMHTVEGKFRDREQEAKDYAKQQRERAASGPKALPA